jgi:hypothetical protein
MEKKERKNISTSRKDVKQYGQGHQATFHRARLNEFNPKRKQSMQPNDDSTQKACKRSSINVVQVQKNKTEVGYRSESKT